MIVTKPFPNTEIIVLKEFSNKEETEILYEYFSSMYIAQKEKKDSIRRVDLADKSLEIIKKLEEKYINFAKENLSFLVEPHFSTLKNFVYWEAGDMMSPHYDNFEGEHISPVMYGCVYYISDNFDGGEIYYPNHNVSYKPVAGEMILHPGTKEYSHGISEVTSGVRITAASFITKQDSSDQTFVFEP